MKTKITVAGKTLELTSKRSKCGVPFPNADAKQGTLHNQFTITVIREDNRVKKSFQFFDCMANYQKGIVDLSEQGLKLAFRSFVDDASYATMDFKHFCSELGYEEDSRRAEKIHKLCKKTLAKAESLGFPESEIYDIINELSEQGIE